MALVGTRTPRKIYWTLFAVAVALPIATIAPWQALASPEPAAAMTSAAARSGPFTSGVDDHISAWAAGAESDPQRDPDRREEDDERRDENTDERRREQQAVAERERGDDERAEEERDEGGKGKEPNPNCTLIVPAAPLTAPGLATPYELVATNRRNGPCREANADQSAFVEATIINPATGALSIYRPLVIDRGTRPAAPPVVPTLPPRAVVGLWFGFQGDVLTLRGAPEDCVNGLP
ncbi:MAG: hypothetical protein ACRD0H_29905, partial [Actinomycetes bacterium]